MPAYAAPCPSKNQLIEGYLSGSKLVFLDKSKGKAYLAGMGIYDADPYQVILAFAGRIVGVFPIIGGRNCVYKIISHEQHISIMEAVESARGA